MKFKVNFKEIFSQSSLAGLDKKQIAVFALVYIAIIFLLVFLVKGRVISFKKVSKELSEKRAALNEAKELIEGADRYRQGIAKLEREIKVYEGKLPERREVPQLFQELDEMAGQSQIKIIAVSSEELEEREHYQRYWRRLTLEGGYHALGHFINRLESSDRFIKVDDIQINSNSENLLKHKINLAVSTFVSKGTI